MPGGNYLIDPATFTSAIIMTCMPREKFGEPGVQETNAAGVKKWSAEIAVSFPPPAPGMKGSSEIISVTLTSDHDPCGGIAQPGPVTFTGLRMGISAPERRDNGRISGGKPFFMADSLSAPATSYRSKSEAA